MKKNYFQSDRWDAGIQNRISEIRIPDAPGGDAPGVLEGLAVGAADLALTYYDKRIRAFFRRAGIDIGEAVLTVESIRQKIESASGLEINDLSQQGIADAIEKRLAGQVSELLGFTVTRVFDAVELQEQVKSHVISRLIDGEGGGVLKGRVLHQLRVAASWERAGISSQERRRILSRHYQRKYRKHHDQTWI